MEITDSGQQAKLAAVLEAAVDAILTIDANGLIDTVNPATLSLFGYERADLIGRNVSMLMPEPFHSAHDGYLAAYLTTGQKNIIGIGRDVVGQRKDGSTFPMTLAVSEFAVDGKIYFAGIVKDLTMRRQAESEAQRLGRIIDQSPSEVYVFSADTLQFVLVNNIACENLGYTLEELKALTPVDLKPEFTSEDFEDLISTLRTGARETLEFTTVHQRKDGSTYDVEIRLNLSGTEDPPVFVAIIQDITERSALEEQLRRSQRMEAIGQLTGGIAHDFNNLLTVIIGNLELIDARVEDENLRDLLQDAQEAADLGATLTDRLLTFARRQPLTPSVVDLNGIVLSMSELLRRTLGENVDLSAVLDNELWHAVIDPGQVENALLNLAINARDAMEGGGRLTIESQNADVDEDYVAAVPGLVSGNYVLISVSDTGTGMPAEVVDRVFEPFFTTKETGRGTGLGLSMVYGFAKESGGHVTVYSEQGVGTTVNLYLPRAVADVDVAVADVPVSANGTLAGEKILVVEDSERVRRLTRRRLEDLGYTVTEAENAPSALEILAENAQFDLVLSDVVMPGGMTGYDLHDRIKVDYPSIAVLLTSGYAEAAVRRGVENGNSLLFLRKPYRTADLAEAVAKALKRAD